jgi:hypothetical protein
LESRSGHEDETDGLSRLVRRILPRGRSAEERLERLLAERQRELDERAARFEETILDLERREQLLRDSRASVERLLRLGTSDLDARELELAEFVRELTEREARVREEEVELRQRRSELGPVELKRAAVETRERALDSREAAIAEREARLEERDVEAEAEAESAIRETGSPRPSLFFVPGPRYRLVELEHPPVGKGAVVVLEGDEYVVLRTSASPLPNDPRPCVYLVRGAPGSTSRRVGSR